MVEGMRISKVSSWIFDLHDHFEPDDSRFLDYHNRFGSSDFGLSITIVVSDHPILVSLITETPAITDKTRITLSNCRFIPSLSHQLPSIHLSGELLFESHSCRATSLLEPKIPVRYQL
ncbi:hypothetical protein TNCT_623791 [Trichonephila clavata]|uniref:Uncharacterized protein n=1 Tax=Trichonephila clavata TaxID=2740835 RepID=A0A8X6J0N0_TRICU|nr:hypothetical protein TNCT_623791 [Trichonephila clavata]